MQSVIEKTEKLQKDSKNSIYALNNCSSGILTGFKKINIGIQLHFFPTRP